MAKSLKNSPADSIKEVLERSDNRISLIVLPREDYESIKEDIRYLRRVMEQRPAKAEEVLYTRYELAKRLDRTPETITRWTKKGILKGHTFGRKRYYKESEVLACLKDHNLD